MSMPTPPDGGAPGYFGVYPAIVTDLVDDENLGRVEVRFPWLGEDGDRDVRAWATLCSPYADDDQGLMIVPEVDSQVLVAFEAGNLRRPYVLGAAWNGSAAQPEKPTAANDLRLLQSRAGSRLEFDDTAGAAKVTVKTDKGHEVVLDDGGNQVTVTSAGGHQVTLDDTGMQVTVSHSAGATITMTATSIKLESNLSVDVSAPMVKVDTPMAKFSGVLQAGTVIATQAVISPSYTPGAGNIY